jgi:hypothetical protein
MLTTIDNPFNPWTQYEEWDAWDQDHGYYTAGYLARIVKTSDEMSEADQDLAIEYAIDEIIQLNPLGRWTKVKQTT